MAPKIAYRNLFHDRMSLIVTLVGIVFSVVLVAIEVGLYKGTESKIATVLDKSKADLWIVPYGTKSFDDPSLLIGHEKYAALSTPGVLKAEDMIVSFSSWRKPGGGKKSFVLVGLDWEKGETHTWGLDEGAEEDLKPDGGSRRPVLLRDLGIEGRGDYAEINGQRVKVAAVTKGIRSFATLPYIFTPITTARKLNSASPVQASLCPGHAQKGRRYRGRARTTGRSASKTAVEVRDPRRSSRARSINYWMFSTGAGLALITGMVLGAIVGVVIVAQTLYASTKDHLERVRRPLRALGASASYIHAGHSDPGSPERGAGLRGRHAARHAGDSPAIGAGADAHHRHDAENRGLSVRADGRHVRFRGHHRDQKGHEDRPGGRLQQVTPDRRPAADLRPACRERTAAGAPPHRRKAVCLELLLRRRVRLRSVGAGSIRCKSD